MIGLGPANARVINVENPVSHRDSFRIDGEPIDIECDAIGVDRLGNRPLESVQLPLELLSQVLADNLNVGNAFAVSAPIFPQDEGSHAAVVGSKERERYAPP